MAHKHHRRRPGDTIGMLAAAGLFVVLIGLTAALIMTFLASSAESEAFDLQQVTADKNKSTVDLTGYFLPEFAGITTGGTGRGISGSSGITAEIFRMSAPALSELMAVECFRGQITGEEWLLLAGESDSVYFRFHERTPLAVLALFAGLYSENESGTAVQGYACELLILPYRESEQYQSGIIRAAVRDSDGTAYLFAKASPQYALTPEDLAQTADSYQSSLYGFVFAGETYTASSPTEPVFTAPVSFRNIIITGNTASLMSESETEDMLRVFEINPDKLLTTHTEDDGTRSYVDSQGVLYIRPSEIEYRSTSDSGIRADDLTGTRWDTTAHTLESYIAASAALWNRICDVGRLYTGEDADVILTSASSYGGTVTVRFAYTMDNLRIMTGCPAMEAVFENGRLRSAAVHTIAVMNLGTRGESADERWFFRTMDGIVPDDVTLVYRDSYSPAYSADYAADAVAAEWAALTVTYDEKGDD